ncbi:hypothetical protein LVD13_07195 [Flavobacteriaceae bacterium D16]|jgi:hypothetical protein|nr:hypothetical protein [Flavobacteriaceae bacterium D16]
MVIFFAIFFALIAVNAFLLLFSARNSSAGSADGNASEESNTAKIYPLDLEPSKFKKAI